MGRKNAPPPPEILRKSGPHKDRTKYDRRKLKDEERRRAEDGDDAPRKPD